MNIDYHALLNAHDPQWYSIAILPIILLLLLYFTYRKLRAIEDEKHRSIQESGPFEPINSPARIKPATGGARRRALTALHKRFNLFRLSVIVIFIFLIGLALVFPMLSKLGATYVSFALATATMILGYMAKPVVENIIAGMVISFGGRIKAGDTVTIDGHYGVVESIHQTYTVIKIWNWTKYILPNNEMLQKCLVNHSHGENYIWAHIEFYVDLDADMDMVEVLAKQAMLSSPHAIESYGGAFWIIGFHQSSLRCWAAAWAEGPDRAFSVRSDACKHLAMAFRQHGIRCYKMSILTHSEMKAAPPDTGGFTMKSGILTPEN